MPSGKAHFRSEMLLWPLMTYSYYALLKPSPVELAFFSGAYLLASLYLSPDLDLQKNSSKRRWGPLGFIWAPYSKIFKHRGISHSMIWGPLTRLIYLGIVIGIVAFGLSYADIYLAGSNFTWLKENLILALIIGLYAPNVLHVLIDRVASLIKRVGNRKVYLR